MFEWKSTAGSCCNPLHINPQSTHNVEKKSKSHEADQSRKESVRVARGSSPSLSLMRSGQTEGTKASNGTKGKESNLAQLGTRGIACSCGFDKLAVNNIIHLLGCIIALFTSPFLLAVETASHLYS